MTRLVIVTFCAWLAFTGLVHAQTDPATFGRTLGKMIGIGVYCGANIEAFSKLAGRAIDAKFSGAQRGDAVKAAASAMTIYAKAGPGGGQSCSEARHELQRSEKMLEAAGY